MKQTKAPGLWIQWVGASVLLTLLSALVYTAGWSYARHYFARFHVEVMAMNLPKNHILLLGFSTLIDQVWPFIALLITLWLLYFILTFFYQRRMETLHRTSRVLVQTLFIFLAPLIVFILFRFFYSFGAHTAREFFFDQLQSDFNQYPRVKVWVTEDMEADMKQKADSWKAGCYRLLYRNKDDVYIFYTNPNFVGPKAVAAGRTMIMLPTDVIPVHKTRMIRMLPHYQSCPG